MRQDLKEHNTNYNDRHTELLLQENLATNNELIRYKQDLAQTKEELRAKKRTMAAIDDKLQRAKPSNEWEEPNKKCERKRIRYA